MKKALAVLSACAVGAAALAGPVTPFSFYAGYFNSPGFTNLAGHGTHLSGLELGVQDSVFSLPIVGSIVVNASAVLGDSLGGGSNGTLFRGSLDYKTPPVPGTSFYAFGGFGYYYATGSGIGNKGGVGTELGVGLPIHILPVGPSFALEARYQWARATTSGFGLDLKVSF